MPQSFKEKFRLLTKPQGLPEPNRAQVLFGVMLWIAPFGFMMASAAGAAWLFGHFPGWRSWNLSLPTWLLINFAFTFGTGWFRTILTNFAPSRTQIAVETAIFVVAQIFIIPALLLLFMLIGSAFGF